MRELILQTKVFKALQKENPQIISPSISGQACLLVAEELQSQADAVNSVVEVCESKH